MAPLIIGIAGGTGSGKTTVALRLAEALGDDVVLLDHDSYYRDQSQATESEREKINYDHPDSLDNVLIAEHIAELKSSRAIEKPIYEFETHSRAAHSLRVEPAPVVVVEGILILAVPALRALFDIKVFVDTPADMRIMRRLERDLRDRGREFDSVRSQYFRTVRPMHEAFVEPSKHHADVIVPLGGKNYVAIRVLVGMIRDFLESPRFP